jgi:hypothetical protein
MTHWQSTGNSIVYMKEVKLLSPKYVIISQNKRKFFSVNCASENVSTHFSSDWIYYQVLLLHSRYYPLCQCIFGFDVNGRSFTANQSLSKWHFTSLLTALERKKKCRMWTLLERRACRNLCWIKTLDKFLSSARINIFALLLIELRNLVNSLETSIWVLLNEIRNSY